MAQQSNCLFADYGLLVVIGVVALIGLILLRILRGGRLSYGDYIFATWNILAFSVHALVDSYFLYTPRVLPKAVNETVPQLDDYRGCFVAAVRQIWREYGAIDARVFLDQYQPFIQTTVFGYAIGSSILCLLAYFGHLRGTKWAHSMQIAAATWHLALFYSSFLPEYLTGFRHIKNPAGFALVNGPFAVFPALALISALRKYCGSHKGEGSLPGSFEDRKKRQ